MLRTIPPKALALCAALFFLSSHAGRAAAQEPTPSPAASATPTAREQELTLRKTLAELERDIAKARREAFEATLPKTQATPLAGTTELTDGVVIESEILAYRTLEQTASSIGQKVSAQLPTTVAIYGAQDIDALAHYQGVRTELSLIEQRYRNVLAVPAPTPCPSGSGFTPFTIGAGIDTAAGVLSGVAGIISLFNTNTEISGAKFTPDELALAALVARDLKDRGVANVFYPSLYPPDVLSLPTAVTATPAAGRSFCDTLTAAGYGEALLQICRIYELKVQTEARITAFDALTDDEKKCFPSYAFAVLSMRALNAQFDKLIENLSAIDDETGFSTVTSIVRAEKLRARLNNANAYVLHVKVQSAGGNNKVTRNLFKGTKLFHSGGSIVSYVLFDNTGAVRTSKTLYNYTGYVKDKHFKKNEERNIADNLANP